MRMAPYHQFHRPLDAGEAGLVGFEVFGVEQCPQHVLDFVARLEVGLLHCVNGATANVVHLVGGEELEQPRADEFCGGVLLRNYLDDVLAIEVACLTEEGLLAASSWSSPR